MPAKHLLVSSSDSLLRIGDSLRFAAGLPQTIVLLVKLMKLSGGFGIVPRFSLYERQLNQSAFGAITAIGQTLFYAILPECKTGDEESNTLFKILLEV